MFLFHRAPTAQIDWTVPGNNYDLMLALGIMLDVVRTTKVERSVLAVITKMANV
jgi:hypothetical protein